MRPRAKGVVVLAPKEPTGAVYQESQRFLKEKAELAIARKAERDSRPVPNYICYPAAFPNFDPKTGKGAPTPLPTCHVCGDKLPPMENHKCEGFTPKYIEHDDAWKEKQEALREAIRESRKNERQRYPTCSVCGEEIEDFEAGQWHWDAHEGRPRRVHQAVDSEPDGDLDGYDDEPEDDYCDHDDGYDCD